MYIYKNGRRMHQNMYFETQKFKKVCGAAAVPEFKKNPLMRREQLSAYPILSAPSSVFENTYFTFFPDFKKHDFLRFFKMAFQKNVKSHKKYQVCWMSIEILASKLPDVMGTYRHLSHTVLSCTVSCDLCPHFWARCLMLVTVTYRYRLPVIE